uniref:Immunoglobulin I-set domain-containing protein n=1 Tax=Timema douglasi TaxID=61478 RepID=A0A7R8ZDJ8_TIMDO|nr:unnamed protein product [Timema douglasi]
MPSQIYGMKRSEIWDKYEAVSMDSGYNKYMMLKIRNVRHMDFGSYKCVAKNSLGETDGVIKLDEIPAPTTTSTTTSTYVTLPAIQGKKGRNKSKNLKDRLSENQVLSDFGLEEWKDLDYNDQDYPLPSMGPYPARQPPGSYGRAERTTTPHDVTSWICVWLLCWLLLQCYS